jgi:hypothetical protein
MDTFCCVELSDTPLIQSEMIFKNHKWSLAITTPNYVSSLDIPIAHQLKDAHIKSSYYAPIMRLWHDDLHDRVDQEDPVIIHVFMVLQRYTSYV